MNPGSIFFDEEFAFHDGETGEKLFVVLGTVGLTSVAAKTTSKPHGRGINFGCQLSDRFPNFYLPVNSCYLRKETWVCLDDFHELEARKMMQKRFSGIIKPVCTLSDDIVRLLQDCALGAADITKYQHGVVSACLVTPPAANTQPTGG